MECRLRKWILGHRTLPVTFLRNYPYTYSQ